jgi:hypothetical protein
LRHYIANNLNAFLRRQRENSATRQYLWIDALCINQTDDDEKAVQIEMMRRIYAESSGLLIWLDEEYGDSDMAMNLVRTFGDPDNQDVRAWTATLSEHIALRSLMERPWWNRIWIVQELALGAKGNKDELAKVICGGKRVTWREFVIAMRRLAKYNGEDRKQYWGTDKALELEEFRFHDEPNRRDGGRSLLWWLVKTRGRFSTETLETNFMVSSVSWILRIRCCLILLWTTKSPLLKSSLTWQFWLLVLNLAWNSCDTAGHSSFPVCRHGFRIGHVHLKNFLCGTSLMRKR